VRVIVNDASVLIDIHKAGILQVYSRAEFTLVLPDVVQKELRDMSDVNFEKLGFEIASLEGPDVLKVKSILDKHSGISIPDTFALIVAEKLTDSILLTGDRRLRNIAVTRNVEVHGVLWILDQLFEQGLLTARVVLDVVRLFSEDPAVRLPAKLLSAYREKYESPDQSSPRD